MRKSFWMMFALVMLVLLVGSGRSLAETGVEDVEILVIRGDTLKIGRASCRERV